ncbi:hypothetical protein ACFQZV_00725 [Microbacterium koreense]|uniref:Uncharacterized protein n=1 Tax=Microbacterium koreense TaxID=323761 RepID=A0ABW2ZMM6_9MICO
MISRPHVVTRPADALLITCAADIAGARHEVLPPLFVVAGGRTVARAAAP